MSINCFPIAVMAVVLYSAKLQLLLCRLLHIRLFENFSTYETDFKGVDKGADGAEAPPRNVGRGPTALGFGGPREPS